MGDLIDQAYDAHNAMADVAALRELVEGTDVPHKVLKCFIFSASSVKDIFMLNDQKSRNCETFQAACGSKCSYQISVRKICGPGQKLCHLCVAFYRDDHQGIESLVRM